MSVSRVLYLAAHGGFAGQAIPLGGGAAVANMLLEEWERKRPFEVELLGPAILGANAPTGRELVEFDEGRYAAFCASFREATTRAALGCDPGETAILVNDISEGPDFAALNRAGFRIVTVYHVDVVAYIAAIYLNGRLRPRTLTQSWEVLRTVGLDRVAPLILRLIFAQQRASLEHSDAVVVPSSGMKEILLECYPKTPASRIHVVPWGAPELPAGDGGGATLRCEYGVPDGAQVLLCLSRISPEKGQDTLLEALLEWEQRGEMAEPAPWLFICGEPAFMHGRRHMERLRGLASRLKRVNVVFPGYVSGARKRAFFEMADVYVFPSRHESYGLTLMEALAAALPAVCLEHQGSRDIMRPEFGRMIVPGGGRAVRERLWRAVAEILGDECGRERMGAAARAYAKERPFGWSAGRVAELLRG